MIALFLWVAGCGGSTSRGTVTVNFAQGSAFLKIRAEVATTPDARSRGLMGRRSLAADAGMLFVFPATVRSGFWMKDTLIPLDIAFIARGRVSEIRTMQPCRVRSCPVTTPSDPYEWALEVNAGAFERAGISVGAVVDTDPRLAPAD